MSTSNRRRFRFGLRTTFVVVAALRICTSLNGANLWAVEAPRPTAELKGRAIHLGSVDATFDIPEEWISWHEEFHNNIHLSPTEIARVRSASGEWDKEYSQIANSIIPFEKCILHAGGDGWGENAASYQDVQMRVYLLDESPAQVVERLTKIGPTDAMKFSDKVSLARSKHNNWLRTILSYPLWYGDYGGTAHIDVFATKCAAKTVVLVFMYCDNPGAPARQVQDIVQSFKCKR